MKKEKFGRIEDDRRPIEMRLRRAFPRSPTFIRSVVLRACAVLLLMCLMTPFVWQTLSTSRLPPRSFSAVPTSDPDCPEKLPSVSLHNSSFCTGPCKAACFPRVQDICFSTNRIKLCLGRGHDPSSVIMGPRGRLLPQPPLPEFMRFYGERLTVGLEYADCDDGWHWIDGLSAVADQRFLPHNKPNPHHEAEKLIPAILLKQMFHAKLHWFSTKLEVSEWARGFLQALGMENSIRYLNLPSREDDSICFRDAVLLSAPTNSRYVPDQGFNHWLRTTVLNYCKLPSRNSSWPFSGALVLDRMGGSRRFHNKPEVRDVVSQALQIPVDLKLSGYGSFCEQVAVVTMADLFVVPHGSQNVVMLFAPPGAVIIEIFPFLFYTSALKNFTHAAQLHVYSVLGQMPPRDWALWLFSTLGWDFCFYKARWCKNHARRQPIYADLLELEQVLGVIQRVNGSFA